MKKILLFLLIIITFLYCITGCGLKEYDFGSGSSELLIVEQPITVNNIIINPEGCVAQRGTLFEDVTNDTYTLDRWAILSDGDGIVDVSKSTDSPEDSSYSIKFSVKTSGKRFGVLQVIESYNSVPFFSKKASISFKAKTFDGRVIENIRCTLLSWNNTANSVESNIISSWNSEGQEPGLVSDWTYENISSNFTLSSVWTRYVIEDILIDTSGMTNLALFIWVDDTDCQSLDELYLSQIQVNMGEKAISYMPRLIGEEINLCKRYYIKWVASTTFVFSSFIGTRNGTSQIRFNVQTPVEMRNKPSIFYSGTTVNAIASDNSVSVDLNSDSSILSIGKQYNRIEFIIENPTAPFIYSGIWFLQIGGGYIQFDSEL